MAKIGLALSGGSARGFAHLGVLHVFENEGIEFDVLAGCSMGSLIGGIYAAGYPLNDVIDMARHFHSLRYADLSNPITGKGGLRGEKIEALLKEMTYGKNIEDGNIPFACVASCIEDGGPYFFTKGPLYTAIRASISIPEVFEPVYIDGKTLVDGGMFDRSALSALEKLEPDEIIAVDVDYHGDGLPTPKNRADVLLLSYQMLSWEAIRRRFDAAKVVITPKIPYDMSNSYKPEDISTIIQIGEQAAVDALDAVRAVTHGQL